MRVKCFASHNTYVCTFKCTKSQKKHMSNFTVKAVFESFFQRRKTGNGWQAGKTFNCLKKKTMHMVLEFCM